MKHQLVRPLIISMGAEKPIDFDENQEKVLDSEPGIGTRPGRPVRVFLDRQFSARSGPGDFQPGFLEPGDFQPEDRPGIFFPLFYFFVFLFSPQISQKSRKYWIVLFMTAVILLYWYEKIFYYLNTLLKTPGLPGSQSPALQPGVRNFHNLSPEPGPAPIPAPN